MNCQKGDLAMTRGAPMDNDLLVEVLEVREIHPVLGQLWLIHSLGSKFHIDPGVRDAHAIWPDCMLRPIRDPGDDAVDETLLMFRIPEFDTV
ncbi:MULTISPECIES: hypothetical protein [unclassified Variovorax]|uniref:hypothetical protein n=1 Tax=unclassified Variovorax TaxID=663243 RepID=UPI003F48A2E0